MRRLNSWTKEQIIEYNLRDGGTAVTVFADAQPGRVEKAREIIDTLLPYCSDRAFIIEPGCSAGDISGPYAEDHRVYGIDVVPAAVKLARERYPAMTVDLGIAEDFEPQACDILVLCEFLEHIEDPFGFVERWGPLARFMVIGHPLVGDGFDPEDGHVWAYERADYVNWFQLAGHQMKEAWTFEMGAYPMVIGWSERE